MTPIWLNQGFRLSDLAVVPHLLVGDGRRVLEDDPLHGLAAGRRGQGAVVDEVLVGGVGQEAPRAEGRHRGALTWAADGTL